MHELDLDSPAFFASPTETLDGLRRRAPVHFHEPWQAYVLTRYADVVRVIRDPAFSVDRGGAIGRSSTAEVRDALDEANRFFGLFMVFSDAPRHTRLRRLLASAFTPARMRAWTRAIDAFLAGRLTELRDRGRPFDLVAEVAEPLPARMTSTILGLPIGAESTLHRFTDDFFAFFGASDSDATTVLRAQKAIRDARAFFVDVLAERRRSPGDDLLSHVVAAELAEPTLSDDELLALAMTIVAGAYGTTTHLIGSAVVASLGVPGTFDAIAADESFADAVVEETFRFDGPALSLVRRSTSDIAIGGVAVPADARIYCMLHAANHDPEVFADPARFDPRRSSNKHLGLGAGAHFCLGASLTRLETARTLVALARTMPELAIFEPATRAGNLSMRGVSRLVVAPSANARPSDSRPMTTEE